MILLSRTALSLIPWRSATGLVFTPVIRRAVEAVSKYPGSAYPSAYPTSSNQACMKSLRPHDTSADSSFACWATHRSSMSRGDLHRITSNQMSMLFAVLVDPITRFAPVRSIFSNRATVRTMSSSTCPSITVSSPTNANCSWVNGMG